MKETQVANANSSHSIKVTWQEPDNGTRVSECVHHMFYTHSWMRNESGGFYLLANVFFLFFGGGVSSRFIPSSIAAKPTLLVRTHPALPSPTMEPHSRHEEVRYALRHRRCCSRERNAAVSPLTIPNLGVLTSDPDHKAVLFQKNKDLFFALKPN